MKYLRIKLFFVILIIYPLVCFADSNLVTANVLHRVFLIKYGDKLGSSFTIDVDNRQYLISAKHFLVNLKESDKIEIFHESKWKKLNVNRIDLKNPNIDILVLAPNIQISPTLELKPSIDNLILSQKVFFLGFPFGMNMEVADLNNYFPLPFVKGGIVSAMDFVNKNEKLLYIDGQNNSGFSGGPIVYFDSSDRKLKVAGVVSGYRNQKDAVYDEDRLTTFKAVTNAGILIGHTIDSAVDAIKSKPIGFEIKSK